MSGSRTKYSCASRRICKSIGFEYHFLLSGTFIVAICATLLKQALTHVMAPTHDIERLPLILHMNQFTDESALLGMCTHGLPVWRQYQFLCGHNNSTSIASTSLPKYAHRLDASWYLTKKCRGNQNCPRMPPSAFETPRLLSIIVPFHNNGNLTCQCILELVLGASPYQAELILIDDASSAEESEQVQQCSQKMRNNYDTPISIHRNRMSMGFSYSCNKGASISKGLLLLFANNDMFVLNGAIPLLVETLARDSKIGLVGPMMIDEHHVQEMGGVIFDDGSAENAFRGMKEIPEEWMRAHQVDYISGACIIIEKHFFIVLDGFDKIYGRGYYEDTDLAMAVRNNSRVVSIQPLAVVYHKEGNTFGAESKEKTLLMKRNHKKFYSKWEDHLKYHLPPGSLPRDAKERLQSKRILWIDQTIPAPSFDSGSQRTSQILKILNGLGHDISFLSMAKEYDKSWIPYLIALRFNGVKILWENLSYSTICTFEIVFIARPNTLMEAYNVLQRCSKTTVVYDTVDLHFVRLARHFFQSHANQKDPTIKSMVSLGKCGYAASTTFAGSSSIVTCAFLAGIEPEIIDEEILAEIKEIGKMFYWEVSKSQIAKQILVVSRNELNVLQSMGIKEEKLAVVSNIYDNFLFSGGSKFGNDFKNRKGGIFVGSFQHPPNLEAVQILCKVAHTIARVDPTFVMHVVGSHKPPAAILKLMSGEPSIQFHGWLEDDDLEKLYSTVLVTIVPLTVGAGVKGKVCSSYLNNVPVIGTEIAFEGLHMRDKNSVLLADSEEDFLNQYMNLRNSPKLWYSLVRNGLQELQQHVSASTATTTLRQILSSLY